MRLLKMSDSAKAFTGRGFIISNDCENVPVGQAWLCEATRSVVSRLYGESGQQLQAGEATSNGGIHRTAIVSQVTKSFGALLNSDASSLSASRILDLLLELEDVAHLGNGFYIPRESRVVRLGDDWGRIAGGLPLEFSEHSEAGIETVSAVSLGRVVRIKDTSGFVDEMSEYSEVFEWSQMSDKHRFSTLLERLPKEMLASPPASSVVYYNSGIRRARSRRDRWLEKNPGGSFTVARGVTLPASYYVCLEGRGGPRINWFEVDSNEARKWILLSERIHNVTNTIRRGIGEGLSFTLPNMYPNSWTQAFLAVASLAVESDNGWQLEVQTCFEDLVLKLTDAANTRIL